jgi:phosphatidylinositol-3,4,5-trisphosphate 3-phosphatase/dual-specificity protein phosphatase PTEN
LVLTPTGSTNLSMNSLPPRENKPLPKLPPTEITVSKQEVEKVEIKTTEVVKKLITLDLSKTTEKRDDKKDQLEGSKPKEEVKVSPRKPDTAFGKLMNFIAPRSPRPEDKSPTPTPEKAKPRLAIVGVTSLIRNVVSKNKKRFQQDGFDLDLSYITPQIVAMGYPSSGFESNYRNPAKEVVRLLETKHKDKYKIYNLCEEKQYDPSTFFSRVESFGFKDHNAPPLAIMRPLCNNIEKWLKERKDNMVCLHCKAGKGRTGVMIAAYLLHNGTCKTAQEALDYFGAKRTKDGKGVTIPSQRRYVQYYEKCLKEGFPKVDKTLLLNEIKWSHCPNDGCKPYFKVTHLSRDLFDFSEKVTTLRRFDMENHVGPISFKTGGVLVKSDICISFFDADQKGKGGKMFHFWLNTNMIEGGKVLLRRSEIDGGVKKDKKCKNYQADFAISVRFEELLK